ncbi:MAG: hypothetical protein NTY41_12555 [Proteobacteria bacterium]|nr:hypothetical protein [Pseudomonadota bacterium]
MEIIHALLAKEDIEGLKQIVVDPVKDPPEICLATKRQRCGQLGEAVDVLRLDPGLVHSFPVKGNLVIEIAERRLQFALLNFCHLDRSQQRFNVQIEIFLFAIDRCLV